MSKKLSRSDALEDISTWSTNDVLALLRKNGLEECCPAITKRQIDGDELLHLTEGKLALWKSDLTRPLIWSLWTFVEEIRRTPEKYVEEKLLEPQVNEDHLSDTGSWGTDFEDEMNEESADVLDTEKVIKRNMEFQSNQKGLSNRKDNNRNTEPRAETATKTEDEETYVNYELAQDEENMYENFEETKSAQIKNVSKLHSEFERSLAEQLKEQLKLRNAKKPSIGPKPDRDKIPPRMVQMSEATSNQPQKSFLHTGPKPPLPIPTKAQKRMSVPPPPAPTYKDPMEKPSKELPKPPATIRNLDLVANLPARTEESEDEYEQFDEQIIEQNKKKNTSKVSAVQSSASGRQSSVESVYQSSSVHSYEEEEERYEIYECITETPEDNDYYLRPIQRTTNKETSPPPLPAKPLQPPLAPSPMLRRLKPENSKERSPEKKSATLPHASSNSSLSTERATRPLPPPPDRHSYIDKPWFHNLTREQATNLIKDQSTYGNSQDGYFLLRPSTTNPNKPLALVLWYRDRVYNVAVRKRPDSRYALGSAKVGELSFTSVEEMVEFYMREELALQTGGVDTGSTKLTNTPPK